MTKGKRKHQQQSSNSPVPVARQNTDTKSTGSAPLAADKLQADETKSVKKDSMSKIGFWARATHPGTTNFVIALFTVVLAGVSFYQGNITARQLGVMRNDERAWLKCDSSSSGNSSQNGTFTIMSGHPLNYPLQLQNIGKTAATNVELHVFTEFVEADKEPSIGQVDDRPRPFHWHMATGIIFPNESMPLRIDRVDNNGAIRNPTADELTAFNQGKTYLAVYGIVTYTDVFKVAHWTRFCAWHAGPSGVYPADACAAFNSVDDN
jgi:hypothetical protein